MHLAHRANLKLLRLIDRTASMRAVTLANQAVRLILAAWLVNHIARTAVTLKETHTEREREREGESWKRVASGTQLPRNGQSLDINNNNNNDDDETAELPTNPSQRLRVVGNDCNATHSVDQWCTIDWHGPSNPSACT
jgi:hypothetical protein